MPTLIRTDDPSSFNRFKGTSSLDRVLILAEGHCIALNLKPKQNVNIVISRVLPGDDPDNRKFRVSDTRRPPAPDGNNEPGPGC